MFGVLDNWSVVGTDHSERMPASRNQPAGWMGPSNDVQSLLLQAWGAALVVVTRHWEERARELGNVS